MTTEEEAISEKNLIRVNAYVSQETKGWLEEYKHKIGKRSYGEVIEELVFRVKNSDQNQLLSELLSDEIAERVIKELKEPIDILRRRTGYSDRQTKVITEVLNHMINTLKLDRTDDNVVLTTKTKTNVLSVAENRIKEQLTHFAQQAATKRNANEQKALEEGDK